MLFSVGVSTVGPPLLYAFCNEKKNYLELTGVKTNGFATLSVHIQFIFDDE